MKYNVAFALAGARRHHASFKVVRTYFGDDDDFVHWQIARSTQY
jgi:hypothetical protein